jgi:DNA-binding transcriptional MerR regulator
VTRLLDTNEAAAHVGVALRTLQVLRKRHPSLLPEARRQGRTRLYRLADVREARRVLTAARRMKLAPGKDRVAVALAAAKEKSSGAKTR